MKLWLDPRPGGGFHAVQVCAPLEKRGADKFPVGIGSWKNKMLAKRLQRYMRRHKDFTRWQRFAGIIQAWPLKARGVFFVEQPRVADKVLPEKFGWYRGEIVPTLAARRKVRLAVRAERGLRHNARLDFFNGDFLEEEL